MPTHFKSTIFLLHKERLDRMTQIKMIPIIKYWMKAANKAHPLTGGAIFGAYTWTIGEDSVVNVDNIPDGV